MPPPAFFVTITTFQTAMSSFCCSFHRILWLNFCVGLFFTQKSDLFTHIKICIHRIRLRAGYVFNYTVHLILEMLMGKDEVYFHKVKSLMYFKVFELIGSIHCKVCFYTTFFFLKPSEISVLQ